MTDKDISVKFTVKEMLQGIDGKLDTINGRLIDGDKKFSGQKVWNKVFSASFSIVFVVLCYIIFG